MDSKWVALGLFGLVTYQMGADPEGTQNGIKSAFTSANAVAKQVPVLFDTSGMGTGGNPSAPASPAPGDPGMQVVSLSDGTQVVLPAGYRVVPTGS